MKTMVQLSHPAAMELVLRKRIAANIYNKQVVMVLDSAFAYMSMKLCYTVDVQIVTILAQLQSDSHLSKIMGT